MSKQIKVKLPDQPASAAPSRKEVQVALKKYKVVSVLSVQLDDDGWSISAEVDDAKPQAKAKVASKPKSETKLKKSLIGSDPK
jgi:hypothetical protein